MHKLIEEIVERAKANRQRIVLPEGTEERTLKAANQILTDGVADLILIGDPAEIEACAKEWGLGNIHKATIIDPENNPKAEEYAQLLCELRKKKGMTIEEAREIVKSPLYLGCLMIKNGDADCQVAGALNTTGDVLRAAFQVLKTKPGISCVSGAFIMQLPEHLPYGTDNMLIFADCAVVPDPTAEELAEIAMSTAETAKNVAGIDPVIAMLSFSTKGSAKHERVDKVIKAVEIVKEKAPQLCLDGELQSDAALVESVGKSKAPGSPVAGRANTLVFPSLEVGNIAYKLVQRLAGAVAVGPVLQGLGAPVNDLSRGCLVEDIYKTIIVTCNQAIGEKGL
jgi:phosphate acetyltransferase